MFVAGAPIRFVLVPLSPEISYFMDYKSSLPPLLPPI